MLRFVLEIVTGFALFLALVGFFSCDWGHMYVPGFMFIVLAAIYTVIGDEPKPRKRR